MEKPNDISRRGFIKSGIAGTMSVAAMGALGGCAPKVASTDEVSEAAPVSGRVSGYAGPGDWLGEAPVIAESDIAETIEADVVVVGSGNAGVEAALAAAEEGATVSVIESMSQDGYMVWGGEMAVWNSDYLKEEWGLIDYDLGEVVDEFVRRALGRVNPDILKSYVHNSGEMFDHLVSILQETEEGKAILDPAVFFVHVQRDPETGEEMDKADYPIVRGGWKTWASDAQFQGEISHEPIEGIASRSNLPAINRIYIARAESLGATWYWENTGVVLVQDDDGAVTGVIAQDKDGKYIKYTAGKGVVLTTGDYTGDPAMCWALQVEAMEWAERQGVAPEDFFGMFGRKGAGHKMVCWAGGSIEPSPRPLMVIGGGGGGPWGMAPFYWCNANGERFCNEASAQTAFGTCGRQPYGLLCTVTDSKWLTSVSLAGVEHGGPNFGRQVYYSEMQDDMDKVVAAGAEGSGVRACTIIERQLNTVYGSNDLAELAEFLGYTGEKKQKFLDSIERYNELCYAGVDTDYGKDAECMLPIDEPPYYGVISANEGCSSTGLIGLAGVITDNDQNVIDQNQKPIKGLYVAGNVLGGRYGTGYSTPSGGNSVGMARTHGRLAGKRVANL